MSMRESASRPRRGRTPSPKQQRFRPLIVLGFLGLLMLLVLGNIALVGRNATDDQAANMLGGLVISDHPTPPNAEQYGRAWGPKDAPIQVIEYVDYECEACGAFARRYEAAVVEAFAASGKVRFEIRNAPFHGDGARNAAAAAYCAAEQNAFWSMHNSLFANQPPMEGKGPQAFSMTRLSALAAKLQLDTQAFDQCLLSGKYMQQVAQDVAITQQEQISRTPTFVINGQQYPGVIRVDQFRQIFAQIAPDVRFDP